MNRFFNEEAVETTMQIGGEVETTMLCASAYLRKARDSGLLLV